MFHTQISESFREEIEDSIEGLSYTNGQLLALTAIRTCYSANKPSEIIGKEGAKYLGKAATDGEGGSDADRLFRHIVRSGHTSTLEGLTFTFAVEGVSRALLAQLSRHRVGFSYSVQSQRYVRFGSGDRSGGFDYVTPDKVASNPDAEYVFDGLMEDLQRAYDKLREAGVPAEDARAVLPNAAATNLVMTANLRALLDFCHKRREGGGAQKEIAELAAALKAAVIEIEPWTRQFFEADKGAK